MWTFTITARGLKNSTVSTDTRDFGMALQEVVAERGDDAEHFSVSCSQVARFPDEAVVAAGLRKFAARMTPVENKSFPLFDSRTRGAVPLRWADEYVVAGEPDRCLDLPASALRWECI